MNPRSANIPSQAQGRDKKRQRQDLGTVRAIEGIGQRETRRPTHMKRAGHELAPIPLGACTTERMITRGGICINPLTSSVQEQTTFRHGKSSRSFVKGTRARGEEMAASSSQNLSVEERLKQLDDTLEKLKQSLQFQLDFLENLDTEAGRRMEQLEQDLSSVKIRFSRRTRQTSSRVEKPSGEI
jgi:hypothetical protein